MEVIYNSIKKDIRNHPVVVSSVLGKVEDWKRSQFVILSDIISEHLSKSTLLPTEKKFELGSTISHITLKRFFDNDYQQKTHNDLRFLKTLEKLCIFLGHQDLSTYIKRRNSSDVPKTTEEIPENFCIDIIKNFCEAQFEATKKLPVHDVSDVLEYVFEDSPLFERIKNFIQEQSQKNLELVTKNNRSNFEIFDYTMILKQEDYKVIKTQEFWNLLFKEVGTKEKYQINRFNTQTYFLKKINGVWKIWDNYNPDAGQIAKA